MILLTPDERDELLETPTTVDELVEETAKRQLKKAAEWLRDLPTDGWDKWHFYHKDLAGIILKELE